MIYLNTANQLSFIIVICFSFSIIAFSFLLNNEKSLSRLLGMSFIIPFLLLIYALICRNIVLAEFLFSFAQASLLLSLFIFLVTKPKSKIHGIIYTLIIIYPIILLIAVSYFEVLPDFMNITTIGITLIIITSVSTMYILRKEKGDKSLIFWASLILLTESTLKLVISNIFTDYLSLLCYIGSYSIFMLYFHREFVKKMFNKINHAEKQLEAVDRNLNLEVRKRVLEIERSNEILVNISKTDALTKALNKAAILDTIGNLINSSKPGKEFALFMFDIDNFKTINDTLGHIVGDKCIKKLAHIAKNSLREIDFFGRYGVDEFVIVLPDATILQAKLIAERLRRKVEETDSPHFTISIGIASYPQDGSSVKELIAAADDGLYHSKSKGRNAVSYKNVF